VLCTLVLLHLFLDFCEVGRFFFFLHTVFVFQFVVINKLCYWISLVTGMCAIFTSWWDSCFVIVAIKFITYAQWDDVIQIQVTVKFLR